MESPQPSKARQGLVMKKTAFEQVWRNLLFQKEIITHYRCYTVASDCLNNVYQHLHYFSTTTALTIGKWYIYGLVI